MPDRRNILFVILDQFRADCLIGPLAAHVDLPNLRALRDDAVSFDAHHAVCTPCGPSRASILTGQYAMNHGAVRNGTPLAHDTPNLATEARRAGYRPLLYGYTDVAQDPRCYDAADPALHTYEEVIPGFHEVLEMRLEESRPWRAHLLARGYDVPPYPDIFRPQGDDPAAPALYRAEDSDTAFLTDSVLRDLAARPPGWFAHVTYIRPHPPLVAPAPYNRLYDPAALPAPVRFAGRGAMRRAHPFLDAVITHHTAASNVVGQPGLGGDTATVAQLRALYLGLATEVDHHIGRLIAFLKNSGQYDDTVVIVTADHGEMLGDHHFWGKTSYFDAAFHTPLMIRDPDHPVQHGARVTAPTESIDIAPTLLELAGRTPPDTMDGHSLRPFLEGRAPGDWRAHSFSEIDFGNPVTPTGLQDTLGLAADAARLAILRGPTHSLVHFNGGLPPVLMPRHGPDAGQDIAATPGAAPILLALSQAMLDHRMTHAAGRFAQTMVTQDGVQHSPRHGGAASGAS